MRLSDLHLERLRESIPQVTPDEAWQLMAQGATLIDIREHDELAQGSPVAAHQLSRSVLEWQVEDVVPDQATTVLLLCATGQRSLYAADALKRLGYDDVRSVAGGFMAWREQALPTNKPVRLSREDINRYARQMILPGVGEAGQVKLQKSKVLIVGIGGLGSPVALYLAAAGVGTLGIVDNDVVELSNLQRQIIHQNCNVGTAKVDSARVAITSLNPSIRVEAQQQTLNHANVDELFEGYDIIVDCSDNFPTKYVVSDACTRLGLPNVFGAIFRFEGQLTVFSSKLTPWAPCYRCLYSNPPPEELMPSCNSAGVLGVLPGVIGTLQASEVLKLILGIGDPLVGQLLCYHALQNEFYKLKLHRDPHCPTCIHSAANAKHMAISAAPGPTSL